MQKMRKKEMRWKNIKRNKKYKSVVACLKMVDCLHWNVYICKKVYYVSGFDVKEKKSQELTR